MDAHLNLIWRILFSAILTSYLGLKLMSLLTVWITVFHLLCLIRRKNFYEYFVLFAQLTSLSPISSVALSDHKARLNNFDHMLASTPVATSESKCQCELWRIIRLLKNKHDLLISRHSGVFFMDYRDYIAKLFLILNDISKFVQLSLVEKCDVNTSIETKF